MNVQGNGSQSTDNFNDALDQFVSQYSRARRGLWAANGRIVELGAAIDYDFSARKILIARVEQVDGVKGSRNFKPEEMDPEQLLLILALGYGKKTKSLRSQYLKTIRKFKETGLERTEAAFVEWVADEGGQRNAAKTSNNSTDDVAGNAGGKGESASENKSDEGKAGKRNSVAKEKLIFNVGKLWKRSRNMPVVSPQLPREIFVQSSAALALVIKGPDINGIPQTRLVPIEADDERVAREALKATQALSLSFREASLIHRLNMFALAFARAPFFPGEITSNAAVKFFRAVAKLKAKPEWCEKYGLADAALPSIAINNDGHENIGTTEIFNKDFHEWDPGRFIEGAKAGALVPYSLKGDRSKISDAAKAYADDFFAWKGRWGKIEKVSNEPFQSSWTNVSDTRENERADEVQDNAVEVCDKPNALQAAVHEADTGNLEPASAPEGADDVEPETVVDAHPEPASDAAEQAVEGEDGSVTRDIDQGVVEAFRTTQREPEMAD